MSHFTYHRHYNTGKICRVLTRNKQVVLCPVVVWPDMHSHRVSN